MNLLALDQASKTSGYAIFSNDKLIDYGHITATSSDLGERLYFIREKIIQLIEKYDIDEVIFEDIQLQESNVVVFKALAEVFGVINELLAELKIPNNTMLSGVWRSRLGIKGKRRAEQKVNAQNWVANTYGLKTTQDEADAICIGSAYLKEEDESVFSWAD